MFAKARRHRDSTSSTATAQGKPLVSPLQSEFDFNLTSPSGRPSSPFTPLGGPSRPSNDSHRSANRISSLQPPVLPPIPRVASKLESNASSSSYESRDQHTRTGKAEERDAGEQLAVQSRDNPLRPKLSFEPPTDRSAGVPPGKRLDSGAGQQSHAWPTTSASPVGETPRMEASVFPRYDTSADKMAYTGPAMTRDFIDSRDKPYSQPSARPSITQSHQSSPNLFSPSSFTDIQPTFNPRDERSQSSISSASPKPSLQSSMTSPLIHERAFSASNHAGSSAKQSNLIPPGPPSLTVSQQPTIGTPYQKTSSSFPLPQHIATRPKTSGPFATVGGVQVPTHHTGTKPELIKGDRRKTRLLNPMALLARRRSGQDDEGLAEGDIRKAQAQAQARQKNVATVGVRALPEDYDPRIKGKIVHDFSAPRPQRQYSYNEADARLQQQPAQSASSPSMMPSQQEYRPVPRHNPHSSESSFRRSQYAPMFVEHLNEDPDNQRRLSSIQAERLENKSFLHRASHQSSASVVSQESSVLPPFARRSQQMDPMQASLFRDDESRRSSDPSSPGARERDSSISASSIVSPITTKSGTNVSDARVSMSPISPDSMERGQRPPSEAPMTASSPEYRPRSQSEATARAFSIALPPQNVDIIAEDDSPLPQHSARRDSPMTPQLVVTPNRDSSHAPEVVFSSERDSGLLSTPFASPLLGSSSASTPEPAVADAAVTGKHPTSPPRLVEKRASAVGHSRKLSGGPKHHVSNASRFSFQMGGSAAEEKALEEKHRKIVGSGGVQRDGQDDDEDDYFDEDAMDDMDEMEVEQQQDDDDEQPEAENPRRSGAAPVASAIPSVQLLQPPQGNNHQPDDDQSSYDGSVYDEDDIPEVTSVRELTYAEHPDFRAHSALAHSRQTSVQSSMWGGSHLDQYMRSGDSDWTPEHYRGPSQSSYRNSNPTTANPPSVQDGSTGELRASSGYFTQAKLSGYNPSTSPVLESPMFPKYEATSKEATQNRPTSGVVAKPVDMPSRKPVSSPTITGVGDRGPNAPMNSPTALTAASQNVGLGLTDFNQFRFSDSPDLSLAGSRPTSAVGAPVPANNVRHSPMVSMSGQSSDYSSPVSNEKSAAYRGVVGKGIRVRTSTSRTQNTQPADDDDMYFDDGGFEDDIRHQPDSGKSMDEDAFDNPVLMQQMTDQHRANQKQSTGHERGLSAVTIASMGSDGPYPTFAIPNPVKARRQESRLLLEDLPLQAPVDPRWIPQRNPSEDAKRLGLSSKVPPLPPHPGLGSEAILRMQNSLNMYHQALADAANKAAAEGRFSRVPSTSTTRSVSVYSKTGGDEGADIDHDDKTYYLRDVDEFASDRSNDVNGHGATTSTKQQELDNTRLNQTTDYSPPRMSFDFGFDSINDDAITDDGFGFGAEDDDIVAAANAEVLANDDDGFYGSEFGFYAKARPRARSGSGEDLGPESVNGGFFGADGDDGLARQKSLKEPNLTPITERSEFSTRNSFISVGAFGPPSSAGNPYAGISPNLARLPISPHVGEGEVTSFEQLRKLRANAFGASNNSLHLSPVSNPNSAGGYGNYYASSSSPASGSWAGPVNMAYAYSNDSSASASSGRYESPQHGGNAFVFPPHQQHYQADNHSPASATSSGRTPYSSSSPIPPPLAAAAELDATPRRPVTSPTAVEPTTARKTTVPATQSPTATASAQNSSSRRTSGIGADSVTYVREADPERAGAPRWVLERRRTSEMGQLELVGREIVQGGWI